jgi:glycosyltransferase involved in cell wall biosynthesis
VKKIKKTKIIIFTDYFFPSFTGGGPTTSIINLLNNQNDNFRFIVITRSEDLTVDSNFLTFFPNKPSRNFGSIIIYVKGSGFFLFIRIFYLINRLKFDSVYFNSFFSKYFTFFPFLLIRLLKNCSNLKILLSPRGELFNSALSNRKFLKNFYILFFSFFLNNKKIKFHATSNQELYSIYNILNVKLDNIFVIPNIPTKPLNFYLFDNNLLNSDNLRLIYLSRIAPIKNLSFIFECLSNVTKKIDFDIYGPIEDIDYYNYCLRLGETLPNNIKFRYCGSVAPTDIKSTICKYHYLVLPSLSENFCHVIYESLSSGTPILASPNTPWHDINDGSITVIELIVSNWISFFNNFKTNKYDHNLIRKICIERAISYYNLYDYKNLYSSMLSLK